MMDQVCEIGFLPPEINARNWLNARLFVIFFTKFMPFLMIFQSFVASSARIHFEKSSKIWHKMKKSLVQLTPLPKSKNRLFKTRSITTAPSCYRVQQLKLSGLRSLLPLAGPVSQYWPVVVILHTAQNIFQNYFVRPRIFDVFDNTSIFTARRDNFRHQI